MTDWVRRGLEGAGSRRGDWEVRACGDGEPPPVCGVYPSLPLANNRLMLDGWELTAAAAPPVSLDGLDPTSVIRYARAGRILIAARVAPGRDGTVA